MLIKALCDYYDILAREGKVLAEGYSNVKVHYKVALTEDGKISEIIDHQKKEIVPGAKGKTKEKTVPRDEIMPQRTEKPGIDANIIEHRPLYLFGLNYEKDGLTPEDKTNKAKKSHEAFVEKNLAFLEGIDTPLVNAFRAFLQNWKPEEERENPKLLGLGKAYSSAGYAFCLWNDSETLLHEEPLVKERWENLFQSKGQEDGGLTGQCAITGEEAEIARIHGKIKGVYGGLATGSVLIGFNNPSENSYGNEQSYNSSISQKAMQKYTEALNKLLADKKHRVLLDDVTVVFWAMDGKETCEDLLSALLFDSSEKLDAEKTEKFLENLTKEAAEGAITAERLAAIDEIDPDVEFYMVGLKPNSSRLAVKFLYRQKFGDILLHVAMHQKDLQMGEGLRPIPLWGIKRELISPKSKNESADPALLSKLLEAILYGSPYPFALLETVVRRGKIDKDMDRNRVRAGILKAYINRECRKNGKKEELQVALDRENRNEAYLCGRLFAILERLQQDASGNSLNRTIKDAYFASAAAMPAVVFPKLLKLAENHFGKAAHGGFYRKQIGEVVELMPCEFPNTLPLVEQGKFMLGYYQQHQSYFAKKDEQTEEAQQYGD
ncbi:type I-C CRISPR-associated protein Cas8c/Csd1 [Anaerotignum sp.]